MTPGRTPTREEADRYLAALTKHFGATVIEKDQAIAAITVVAPPIGMIIKGLVAAIGDSGFHVFDYAVLPARWTPLQRITYGSHEVRHIHDLDTMGWAAYYAKYLSTMLGRADLEANGYSTDMELEHALTGKIPSLAELGGAVDNASYLLDAQARKLVETKLHQRAAALQAGAHPQSPVSIWGIGWLRANLPELLAS